MEGGWLGVLRTKFALEEKGNTRICSMKVGRLETLLGRDKQIG